MSNTIEKRIIKSLEYSPLMDFIGEDNVERLKKEVTDIIINQVFKDLEANCEYIIDVEEIRNDIVKDITKECKEKIRPLIEKKLYESCMKKLGLEDWEWI